MTSSVVINQVSELVAAAGYLPDTLVAGLALRFQVANLRDANGQPIFRDESFAGFRTYFNKNGAWNAASAAALVVIFAVRDRVRQDITVKLLDQATVGSINLAERDMVAIRMKARSHVLGDGATAAAGVKFGRFGDPGAVGS